MKRNLCRALQLVASFATAAALSDVAHAQKSANQCAREVGSATGEERTKKMMDCLLGHIPKGTYAPKPPRDPGDYFIRDFSFKVNSAGGVEPALKVVNPNKDSAIKYLTLTIERYNAVGDRLGPLEIVRMTGPVSFEEDSVGFSSKSIAYGANTACLLITFVVVELMNGSTTSFMGPDIRKALHPSVRNDCAVRIR